MKKVGLALAVQIWSTPAVAIDATTNFVGDVPSAGKFEIVNKGHVHYFLVSEVQCSVVYG